jgi:hypothetical protein
MAGVVRTRLNKPVARRMVESFASQGSMNEINRIA